MLIKATIPFSYVTDSGLYSVACGEIVNLDDTLAEEFIADGLAEQYTLITPRSNIEITENKTYDVTQYAGAVVNVPNPSTGTLPITENGTYDVTEYASVTVNVDILTITYNANGGTGTVAPVNVAAGDSVNLSDGTGITAPSEKVFAGWATEAATDTPDVTSPYTPIASVTLYAVYTDAAPAQ